LTRIDISAFQPAAHLKGDSAEDTALLKESATEARDYIQSFAWCPPIEEMYFADGVGGIVALFLVALTQKIQNTDDMLWVVVGDLPSAYMVVEDDETPPVALTKYCDLMEKWIDAVREPRMLADAFPVRADPTLENATLLKGRLEFLRREIIGK
jgi:hypothetical protein